MTEKQKMTNPLGRMTARDALVYAAGEEHGNCTVVVKGRPSGKTDKATIAFKCTCGVMYVIKATESIKEALRNVPEDKKL